MANIAQKKEWVKHRGTHMTKVLDECILPEDIEGYILDYYQVYDRDERFGISHSILRNIEQREHYVKKYPECFKAIQYNIVLHHTLIQHEQSIYRDRLDVIEDIDIPEELREYIINSYRKAGYSYGVRIRRVDDSYVIYWDKIQIEDLTFQDLNLNYFLELSQNGYQKTQEKLKRLLR